MKRLDSQNILQCDMIAAKLWKSGVFRLITVIDNTPWYRSTGRNSGYEGTWFFFGGILEKKSGRHSSGWLIKPRALTNDYHKTRFFGHNTIHYEREQSINKLISFSRFGDIKKICISASLGGGFWLSDKGERLKTYLHDNYSEYFLNEELIRKINDTAMKPDLPVYTKRKQVNQWLHQQGVATIGMLHNEHLLFKP